MAPSNVCLILPASVGLSQTLMKTCRRGQIFEQAECKNMPTAGGVASHFGKARADRSGRSSFKIHWDLLEPLVHTHSMYMHELGYVHLGSF